MTAKPTETVKVMVRTRPMNQKEFDRGNTKSQQNQVKTKKLTVCGLLQKKFADLLTSGKRDDEDLSNEIPFLNVNLFVLLYHDNNNNHPTQTAYMHLQTQQYKTVS